MECFTLKYKDIDVCQILCNEQGKIISVGELYQTDYLPLGVHPDDHCLENMSEWWRNNAIPITRDSIRIGLECLGVNDPEELRILGMGLSLTNHYWIQPEGKNFRWSEINYFENNFSKQVGEALFNHAPVNKSNQAMYMSPDISLGGMLQKKWVIDHGKRILIKCGSGSLAQEPYNEVLAGRLFEAAGIPAVQYQLKLEKQRIVCACECFTDNEWEFIPGMTLLKEYPAPVYPSVHPYDHYLQLMDQLEIRNCRKIVDGMICIDYVIANTDRHYNNFGVLYNREKNVYKFAPMFDSGTSMYNNTNIKYVDFNNDDFNVRPFSSYGIFTTPAKQIQLVQEFSGINNEILLQNLAGYQTALRKHSDMSESRINLLCQGVVTRYNKMVEILEHKNIRLTKGCGSITDEMLKTGIRYDDRKSGYFAVMTKPAAYAEAPANSIEDFLEK